LLCPWLLLCEELLLLPLDFPASFAKAISVKNNTVSIKTTNAYLTIFLFFLANIILLLSLFTSFSIFFLSSSLFHNDYFSFFSSFVFFLYSLFQSISSEFFINLS